MNAHPDPNPQKTSAAQGSAPTTPVPASLDAQACAIFQAQLPELLGSGNDLATHPHLSGCSLCQALLADLESIAEAARQLLAPVEPPDQLWSQIEMRLRNEESNPQE